MPLSAFVVGYTGEVGKCVVQELARNEAFGRIVLLGRRKVAYPEDLGRRLEQKVVDFEKLEDYADSFKDFDVGYCCLGTTRAKAGSAEAFRHIDYGYSFKTAQLAKQGGCKQYHLVSSSGANKNSILLYPEVKGKLEADISAMGFEKFFIYRPKILLCEREQSNITERVARFCLAPIIAMNSTLLSVPTVTVARAMISKTLASPSAEAVEMVDNDAIHRLGKATEAPSDKPIAETGK